jgi:hypothetical protein
METTHFAHMCRINISPSFLKAKHIPFKKISCKYQQRIFYCGLPKALLYKNEQKWGFSHLKIQEYSDLLLKHY